MKIMIVNQNGNAVKLTKNFVKKMAKTQALKNATTNLIDTVGNKPFGKNNFCSRIIHNLKREKPAKKIDFNKIDDDIFKPLNTNVIDV